MALRNPSKKKKRTATTGVVDGGAAQTAVAPAPAAVPELAQALPPTVSLPSSSAQDELLALGPEVSGGQSSPQQRALRQSELNAQQLGPTSLEEIAANQARSLAGGDLPGDSVVPTGQAAGGTTATEDILGRGASIPGGPESGVGTQGGTAREELLGMERQQLGGKTPGGIGTTEGKKQFLLESGLVPEGGQSFAEWSSGRPQDEMVRSPEQQRQKQARDQAAYEKEFGLDPGTAQKQQLALQQEFQRQQGAGGGGPGSGVSVAGAPPGSGGEVLPADPIPRDFGVGPPLKPDEPGVDPEARSRYERFQPGTFGGQTTVKTDFGETNLSTTTHNIHPDVAIPTFNPPDFLDPQSKKIWEEDNAKIVEMLEQFRVDHTTRTERSNGTFGYDTLNDEARKALQGIQFEIDNIQTRQKQLLSTFGPQGDEQKAGARSPDPNVSEVDIQASEATGPDVSGVVPEGGVTERPDGAPPIGEAGEIGESERELADGVDVETPELTPEQEEFKEKVIETAKGGDIPATIQESGVLDDVFEKLIEEMGGVSDEEKSTIRKKYEIATQKALSGLSSRGLGRGSAAVIAAAQGEIGATAEIGAAEREARSKSVEAAKAAGELALASRGVTYDAYFKAQVIDIDRTMADQNYQIATKGQDLAELRNAQDQSMEEAKLALEERLGLKAADLSDAQLKEAQRQFEAEFGLKFDAEGFSQWLETGELNLSVMDLQETTRLNEMRIANDFAISDAGLKLERELGLAENELARWIAGESIDLERASQAIERWADQMGFDLAESEILVQLTAIAEGGPNTLQTLASIGTAIARFAVLFA